MVFEQNLEKKVWNFIDEIKISDHVKFESEPLESNLFMVGCSAKEQPPSTKPAAKKKVDDGKNKTTVSSLWIINFTSNITSSGGWLFSSKAKKQGSYHTVLSIDEFDCEAYSCFTPAVDPKTFSFTALGSNPDAD